MLSRRGNAVVVVGHLGLEGQPQDVTTLQRCKPVTKLQTVNNASDNTVIDNFTIGTTT
jgi:hypothetical protein